MDILMFTSNPRPKKRKLYAQRHLQAVLSKLLGIVAPNVAVAVAINEKTQKAYIRRSNSTCAGGRKNDDQEKSPKENTI
jgi:hypothetical protein